MPRKKRVDGLPAPLRLLQAYTKRFPKAWGQCDGMVADKGKQLPSWDDACIIPISATMSVAQDGNGQMVDAVAIAALYAWRQYKEIYSFDQDLAAMLMEQGEGKEEMNIPVEALRLPYPCIYIQLDSETGFFVWFECEPDCFEHPSKELRFLPVVKGEISSGYYMMHIEDGGTILDGVEAVSRRAIANAESMETMQNLRDFMSDEEPNMDVLKSPEAVTVHAEIISRLLQLVLYICADNCEQEENPEQKAVRKDRDTSKPLPAPKDRLAEVQKWDVGYRIGNAIRGSSGSSSGASGTGTGTRKRPHSRRGHWHHYWRGSDKDGSRRLLLKWTAPMFIHMDDSGEMPAVIHPVERE